MANRWGNNGNSERLFSWAPKSLQIVTAAMKLKDTPSKKSYDNPRQHITDITLPANIHIGKAMVFPVVRYGYESWTIKLSAKELMLLNCGVGKDS